MMQTQGHQNSPGKWSHVTSATTQANAGSNKKGHFPNK